MSTIKFVGNEREWEGNLNRWEKHKECIVHWCDGGEVEWLRDNNDLVEVFYPFFAIENEYRKKQRAPKAGEVWEQSGWYSWLRVEDVNGNFNGWVSVDGCNVSKIPEPDNLKFIASSLGEYYSK
jgi:hypothetical protein